ncbi:MAG TPA: hypothetical protein VLO11_14905 [Luteolibacter sp.]|nr:hypothetical protein [Luteolibacter sp.]
MRSLFGMILVMVVALLVVAGCGLIWYLSSSAEFSRVDQPAVESR